MCRDGFPRRPRVGSAALSRRGPSPTDAARSAAGAVLLAGSLLAATATAAAQDGNVRLHPDTAEARLARGYFELIRSQDTRFEGDRTQQALLDFSGQPMLVKWARAPRGGGTFNNQPRYELAAYRLQKLFLDPADYVVPPTVVRSFPLAWYREVDPRARPTFGGTGSVLAVLQYWLWNVTDEGVFDEDRFERDLPYARHLANLNVFTYLVRHNDANQGNVLLSESPENPRLFAVDNGVAFDSEVSNRGYDWRRMRVDRIPRATAERLRALTRQRLREALGVLVQFELRGEELFMVSPGENLDPGRGVRREGGIVQLGLTEREISGVWRRIEDLLEEVDDGDLALF